MAHHSYKFAGIKESYLDTFSVIRRVDHIPGYLSELSRAL